jgi:peptidoglycan glycosyltransferase
LYTFKKENSWRQHQQAFISKQRKKSLVRKSSKLAAVLALSFGLVLGAVWFFSRPPEKQAGLQPLVASEPISAPIPRMPLARVRDLSAQTHYLNAVQNHFFVDTPTESYTLKTRLDTRLQNRLNATLDHLKQLDRGKPQRVAMVAIDGESGMIKALAGFDLENPKSNPCTASAYPAASIFKIVTASAAIDTLGYTPDTPLFYNGQKYTLYKRQLKESRNKYTRRVTLAQAFAESINPVFGKIGKNALGRETMDSYARAFGFNGTPETDLLMDTGRFAVTDSDYHLAELGCGFNRQTKISPIFGAVLVSAVLNQGKALVPRMVDRVELPDGSRVYSSKKQVYTSPIRPRTAAAMMALMQKTVSRGTARKAFRGYTRDKVLSKLTIGGKTGSLYSTDRTVKYDWFVGFGRHKKTGKSLAVSVVVGHRKYIGTRAATHAKNMLKTYFYPRSDAATQKGAGQ